MSNETSARVEGESGTKMERWPECMRYESKTGEVFNVRLVNKPDDKIVYTRSDVNGIFTVTLKEWLVDIGELPEPKVGESGLSDEQPHIADTREPVNYETERTFAGMYLNDVYPPEAKPEPLPNTLSTREEPCEWNGRILSDHHDLVNMHGGGMRCAKCKKEWLAAIQEMPAPDTLQEEPARTIVKRIVTNAISAVFGRFDIKRDYVNEDGEGLNEDELIADALALALGDDIGCLDENDDDFRERIDLLWLEDLLAAPKVVDSKEEQEFQPRFVLTGGSVWDNQEQCFWYKAPKVEEQDGELPELPERWDLRQDEIGLFMKVVRNGEFVRWHRYADLRALLVAEIAENKLLKAESVAPPSLPKQEFEAWWDEEIRLAQIHLGSGDYWVSKGIANKSWNAGRAAAPVALPTHRVVSEFIGARYATQRCSCGRTFIGMGDEARASARASFEAHLPEKERK